MKHACAIEFDWARIVAYLYPVKSHQDLTMTVQSAMTSQLKPRLQIYLS